MDPVAAFASEVSGQAVSILRQLVDSGAQEFGKVGSMQSVILPFISGGGSVQIQDFRCLDDDLKALVNLGLLIPRVGSRGTEFYRATRNTVKFVQAIAEGREEVTRLRNAAAASQPSLPVAGVAENRRTWRDEVDDLVWAFRGSGVRFMTVRILAGCVLPFLVGIPGLITIVRRKGFVAGGGWAARGGVMPAGVAVTGVTAVVYGLAWVCLAAGFHFHFFYPMQRYTLSAKGKMWSVGIGVLCWGYALASICFPPGLPSLLHTPAKPEPATIQVLAATRDMPAGTRLAPSDFRTVSVPEQRGLIPLTPSHAHRIIGKRIRHAHCAGQPMRWSTIDWFRKEDTAEHDESTVPLKAAPSASSEVR